MRPWTCRSAQAINIRDEICDHDRRDQRVSRQSVSKGVSRKSRCLIRSSDSNRPFNARDPLACPLEIERDLLDEKRKLRERGGPQAEYPLRAHEQNQQKDDKRKPIRCLGIDIGVGALGENAKQDAAGHRERGILGSSDHHRNKTEGVERAAQVGVGEGARGDQNAGYSR